MSTETGGKTTSAVPVGTVGTSAVSGADPTGREPFCVVATSPGERMAPIVGGVVEFGTRSSSSDVENPYATRAAAMTTPAVTAIRVVRDRRFDALGSATSATLSR
jgi:hypothetical protein